MFDFYYSQGDARRKSFKVKGDVCTIGSARSNDLVLSTKAMAKRHVELRLRPSGLHITDLGSLSGTWVNRERIKDYGPLSDLDEIIVGDVSVVLDGMPVITDDLLAGEAGDEAKRHDSAISRAEQYALEQEEQFAKNGTKAKRGGLFGLFSNVSDKEAVSEDDNAKHGSEPVSAKAVSPPPNTAKTNAPTHSINENSVGEQVVDQAGPGSGQSINAQHSGDGAATPDSTAADAANTDTEKQSENAVVSEEAVKEEVPFESAFTKEDEELAYWSNIVHEQLLNQMDLRRKDVNRMTDDDLRQEATLLIDQIVKGLTKQLPETLDVVSLASNVVNEAVGLGPLERFLEDDDVTEIMVNNHAEIFLEKNGQIVRSKNQFSSDATVYAVIERIITPIGRRIDESSPIVDARLKDGSRVNAVIPPLALKGPSITIRKFPKFRMQFSDLVKFGSVNQQMVDFFQVCVESHKNIIVAGGTGSGKTTLLNVLSNFIPDEDRIVTIEDAAELSLVQPNLVSLESRPPNVEGKGGVPIRDLVKNSLRMRPDRIVIGECRGGEAIDMLQAMNTGHDGSLTTIHANTPRDVISRLEVLVLMAGLDLPVTAIREQVASAVHLIVQQTRYPCGSRKISKVTEVVGVESGTVQLQDIFEYKQQGFGPDNKVRGVFQPTGFIPTFYDELRLMGKDVDISVFNNSRASEVA